MIFNGFILKNDILLDTRVVRSGIREQRSEVRSQKSDSRGRRLDQGRWIREDEKGKQMSEVG
jgi:hypothetical protein